MEVKVMLDAIDKYELVHKNLRLVKVDSDNCFDLADLSIKEDQIGFVAPNQESMALAFGTLNEGKYVEAFGLYDGGILVGFVMIGHNSFDFPVNICDIERIEVLEGPAARVYGTSSLLGAVNIVTRKGSGNAATASVEGGSFGSFGATASVDLAATKPAG